MSTDIHALSGAYAVDALDDIERADFERHLAGCESCRHEVADLQAAAAEIAATTELAPPPSLRDSVLAGIADVRPLPPLHPEVSADISAEPAPSNVRELPRRRRWTQLGLVAAAAAIVAGGSTVAWHPWDQPAAPPSYSAGEQVIHAADVQRYTGDVAGGGTVTVYRSVALDKAFVVAKGVPAAPAGRVYELWLQGPSGAMKPAGLFTGGSAYQKVTGHAGPAKGVGVTIEPAGGSDVPTTNPIALIPLASA